MSPPFFFHFFLRKCLVYVDGESTVFLAPQLITHLLSQQFSRASLHYTLLSLIEIHPRHLFFHPAQPLTLSQTFSPSLSELLHCLRGGHFGLARLGSEDTREIWSFGSQDPTGLPKLAQAAPHPIWPSVAQDGMTSNPLQACYGESCTGTQGSPMSMGSGHGQDGWALTNRAG